MKSKCLILGELSLTLKILTSVLRNLQPPDLWYRYTQMKMY